MRAMTRNPGLLCAFNALQMSLFPVSIMTLFWNQRIGMSMSQIFAVQAFFGLTMAVFEFPSGYVADRIGYRRSLVAASMLGVVGWGLYSQAGSLLAVIAAEAVLGVSVSLVSGCDAALLYESLRATGREGEFGRWLGRSRFWGQASEGTAALGAGLLYAWAPGLPFAVQTGVSVLSLGISLQMLEPARHQPMREGHWRQIQQLVRHALVDNRLLTSVLVLTIVLGMSSFVPVWLVPIYATRAGVPETWIGPIWAVANYVVAIASLFSTRVAASIGLWPMLGGCVGLIAVGYSGLALTHAPRHQLHDRTRRGSVQGKACITGARIREVRLPPCAPSRRRQARRSRARREGRGRALALSAAQARGQHGRRARISLHRAGEVPPRLGKRTPHECAPAEPAGNPGASPPIIARVGGPRVLTTDRYRDSRRALLRYCSIASTTRLKTTRTSLSIGRSIALR
jgi:MFS family permease